MSSSRQTRTQSVRTLSELLQTRAEHDPAGAACICLDEHGAEARRLTYADIDAEARACGAAIATRAPTGSRVVLMTVSGADFIRGFFGCLYAGTVPVPVHPARRGRALERARHVIADARPAAIVARADLLARVAQEWPGASQAQRGGPWPALIDLHEAVDAATFAPVTGAASDLALLQYTSGSTSDPKGVMLRHEQVLSNQTMIQHAFRTTASSVVVSWLPMQHDMGLIGALLHPIYMGCPLVAMPPEAVMANPAIWLRAISTYRGTVSGAPNSAFDFCVDRIGEQERASLDLRSWAVAFNGSEPVRAATMDRFATAFAPCGFSRASFMPCYGLAEATLLVSACAPGDEPPASAPTRPDPPPPVISAGTPAPALRVLIADAERRLPCADGEEGEIWVSSPSVGAGYWQRPELTEDTFRAALMNGDGPFLRTGDLGFMRDGALYVTGRSKDLIIINGQNYYPQDLEEAARACHPTLSSAPAAAFALDRHEQEGVAIVLELQPPHEPRAGDLLPRIRQLVLERHDVLPSLIVLVKRGAVPRTTSGKVQRSACRRLLEARELPVVAYWDSDSPSASSASTSAGEAGGDPVLVWLRSTIAEQCGVDAATIAGDQIVSRLGLESMAAVQCLQRIERHFGVTLRVTSLLSDATIQDLAREIHARMADARPMAPASAVRDEEHPASHRQQSLWLHAQMHPGATTYTIAHAVHVRPGLDTGACRRALARLVARHEALRTVFAVRDGSVVQIVRATGEIPLREHARADVNDETLRADIAARAWEPFDLAHGPLARVDLFTRPGGGHVLLLAVHHAIADLWSLAILLRELGALYEAEVRGRRAALPALPLQYADHVRRELALLESEGERLWSFWRGRLAGDVPPLEVPTDFVPPETPTFQCGVRTFRLSRETSDRVGAAARRFGVTPYVILLAGYAALLHRYSRQDDIIIGSVVAGRERADVADLIGYCVDTIPLRCDLTGSPAAQALVPRIRARVVEALDHQAYPFPLMLERLRGERRSDPAPLFQTMFVYQSTVSDQSVPLAALALGERGEAVPWAGHAIEPLTIDGRTSNYPLTLVMAARDGHYAGTLEFHTELFDAATAERMVGHYQQLIDAMLAQPDCPIAELDMLPEEQRRQVVHDWNATTVDYGPAECLHDLIDAQARRTPRAEAVRSASSSLTYAALVQSANTLAAYLRASGVGPETVVGIDLERSCQLMIALLGVLKAGAAYMPIDRTFPADRIRAMLDEADCRIVLTNRRGGAWPAHERARVIRLDEDAADIAAFGGALPDVCVDPANAAYVIYTSGSTGRPKGVVNTHAGIVNRLRWMQDYFRIGQDDRVLQKTPYTFDVSVWEFFWPLMTGACVVMAEPGGHQDPRYLAELLDEEQITTLHFVPSMLRAILRDAGLGRASSLRRVICSGEALPRRVQQQFLVRYPGVELHNLYGPTEAAVDVTAWRCRHEPRDVPIGRPIANTRIYLLDRHLAPVPPGLTGELYIAGVNVARGYLRRPALTAERFVPDPFDDTGGRMYRTGDLARYRADGAIEFLGRCDEQVKIRGARIELGEIEAVLVRSRLVRDAVAVVRDTAQGDPQIIAYVVPREGVGLGDIRHAAAEGLPSYMMPGAFVPIEALPLSANGKLDKRQLPAPDVTRAELTRPYVPPRDALEEELVALWASTLNVAPIGVDDSFFELGGHSLLVTQLVARVREQFGLDVPMRVFFDAPTIAELADVIRGSRADRAGVDVMSELVDALERLGDPDLEPPAIQTPATLARAEGLS